MSYYLKKYGPIFRLKLGSWNAVFLTDYHQIKRAFASTEFSHRPGVLNFEMMDFHGLASASGPKWQEQRRFALNKLRDLGMGRTNMMEIPILYEVQAVTNELKRFAASGEAVNLNMTLNIAVTNIVWKIAAGMMSFYI